MLVDCEVHLLPPAWCAAGWRPPAAEDVLRRVVWDHPDRDRALAGATAEGLSASMATAGIDGAVIMGLPWRDAAMNRANDAYIAEVVRRAPGRFAGMSLLPAPGSADLVDAVHRAAGEGFRGLKVIPSWQGWRLDDPVLIPALEEAERLGLVLMPHTDQGYLPPEAGDPPHALLTVARRHPGLRILAPHLGGLLALYALHPPVGAALGNLLFIASMPTTMRMAVWAVEAAGAERVCFGTDFPFNPSHDQKSLADVFAALPLAPADRLRVASTNIAAFLGMPAWNSTGEASCGS